MKTLLLTLTLLSALFAADTTQTLAIMDFRNHGPVEYDDFLKGVPDMMMTNLGNIKGLRVIERVQVEKAMRAFDMESSGLTRENTVKIGQWLGADILVMGSMIKSGQTLRFDARFVDAATGVQMAGSSVTGMESEALGLVDQLCARIAERFTRKHRVDTAAVPVASELPAQPVRIAPQSSAPIAPSYQRQSTDPGVLRISFKMFCSLLAEEKYYHQRCRILIDNREVKQSGVVDRLDADFELYNDVVAPGSHVVEVVHMYVNKKGECVRKADEQPRVFLIRILPGENYLIQYRLKIGTEGHNEMVYGDKRKIQLF